MGRPEWRPLAEYLLCAGGDPPTSLAVAAATPTEQAREFHLRGLRELGHSASCGLGEIQGWLTRSPHMLFCIVQASFHSAFNNLFIFTQGMQHVTCSLPFSLLGDSNMHVLPDT